MDVPSHARAIALSSSRPTRPRLRGEAGAGRVRAQRAALGAAGIGVTGASVVIAKPKLVALVAAATKWWVTLGTAAVVAVATVGTVSEIKHRQAAKARTSIFARDVDDATLTADGSDTSRINRWPAPSKAIATYLSQDMSGGSIAWVIDTSKDMTPYYSTLARLTHVAMMNLQPGSQRFGVVLASAGGPQIRYVEFVSKDAYRRARELIDGVTPTGTADLPAAFSAAARQRPDKIFLVAGERVDPEAASEMRRQAKAVGTVVNVIALGEDQKPLRRLARATSGDYKIIDEKSLDIWAQLIAQNGTLHKLEKDYFER